MIKDWNQATDEELIQEYRSRWKSSQAAFCKQFGGIHQGNYSQYLNRIRKTSPASRSAIIQFLYSMEGSNTTDSFEFFTISKLPCKYFLKGKCSAGKLCHFLHPKDSTYTLDSFKQQQTTLSKLQKILYQLIIFLDSDQIPHSKLDQLFAIKPLENIHIIFCHSPTHNDYFCPKEKLKSPFLSIVRSVTTASNAVDILIASLSTRLDIQLPKDTQFCFISQDWFVVELCEQFKANGRHAFSSDQISCDIVQQWSKIKKWIEPKNETKPDDNHVEQLAIILLDKIKKFICENDIRYILLAQLGDMFALEGSLKEIYGNWTHFLQSELAEQYLNAKVIKNSKDQSLLAVLQNQVNKLQ